MKLQLATKIAALSIPLSVLTACGNSNVASEDYVNGFRAGQLFYMSTYGTELWDNKEFSGRDACETIVNSGLYPAITSALSSEDAFAGCADGYEAEVGSDAPNVGDPLQ